MSVQSWWEGFGEAVDSAHGLVPVLAQQLATVAHERAVAGITFTGLRQSQELGYAGVRINVEPERPQDLAYPIQSVEPIAVLFPFIGGQPSVLSLRDDFPDTPHQNWVPPGFPCALCIDDRPWAEARLTATGFDIGQRILLWLSRAARGELHDVSQPPEPLFFASELRLVVPAYALNTEVPVELMGFRRQDNPDLIFARKAQSSDGTPTFTVLAFQAQLQNMMRLRHAPRTLATLATELERYGINLYDELKIRLKTCAGLGPEEIRRSLTRLAIVVAFQVASDRQQSVNDVRAFITHENAGEIGVALGVLQTNRSEVGDTRAFMLAVPVGEPTGQDPKIEPAQVHYGPSRKLAATIAGASTPDCRRVVLVGAGSLGSQLSLNLAREGRLVWTVVDDDYLLPHNLYRHGMFAEDLGAPKAGALAHKLGGVLDEVPEAIQCDVLNPKESERGRLHDALTKADIVIDASASVAVSRHLCDMPATRARRICVFFNPAGTSVTVLVESADHSINLRDLEAQHFRSVITDSRVSTQFELDGAGVRFSGACRALTNRIPASSAALLSALAARGITNALTTDEATVSIWTLKTNGEVQPVFYQGAPVTQTRDGDWTIVHDEALVSHLVTLRHEKLPNETGGVLLGVVDISRKSIHVLHALREPGDSRGSETSFERGIVDLRDQVNRVMLATMHQVRYVGEWHSHPGESSAIPSRTDLAQLAWLRKELENEGLPGLMAIVAEDVVALSVSRRHRVREETYLWPLEACAMEGSTRMPKPQIYNLSLKHTLTGMTS